MDQIRAAAAWSGSGRSGGNGGEAGLRPVPIGWAFWRSTNKQIHAYASAELDLVQATRCLISPRCPKSGGPPCHLWPVSQCSPRVIKGRASLPVLYHTI